MIESIIIYLGLTWIMYYYTSKAAIIHGSRITGSFSGREFLFLSIAILAFATIFGMRYYVGVDYPIYLEIYNSADYRMERYEPAFYFLTEFCQNHKFHYSVYFGIISAIQITSIFVAFRSEIKVIPWICFVLMFSGIAICSMTNGLRQWLALCLCILSVSFIDWNRKWKIVICFLLILVGALFHRSCYIFLIIPLLFVPSNKYFVSKKYQYIFLILFYFLPFSGLFGSLYSILESAAFYLDYENYLYDIVLEKEVQFGIFNILQLLLYVLMIRYSDIIRDYYNSRLFNTLYGISFIGILLNNLMAGSVMLQRTVLYFYVFYYIIIAFYLLYLSKQKLHEMRRLYIIIVIFFSLTFARTMMLMSSNTAQYVFFFQDDMHAEKERQYGLRKAIVN